MILSNQYSLLYIYLFLNTCFFYLRINKVIIIVIIIILFQRFCNDCRYIQEQFFGALSDSASGFHMSCG